MTAAALAGRRSLVIGANGLVGAQALRLLQAAGAEVLGTCHRRATAGLRPLDITDAAALDAAFAAFAPQLVFHCANTPGGVDFCEREPERARAFHVDASAALARRCAEAGARLVFVSSDYVFPDRERPQTEEDAPAPLNAYGAMKLQAERAIAAALPAHTIARTTNVYGWDPDTVTPNFVMNLWRTLREGRRFPAPAYLWGNPTLAADLAQAMVELAAGAHDGVFHVVGPDYVNRHQWALAACRALALDAQRVDAVAEAPAGIVPRPMRLSLATGKLRRTLGGVPRGLDAGLAAMAQEAR